MIVENEHSLTLHRTEALDVAREIVEAHLDDYAPGRRLLRQLLIGAIRARLIALELDSAELDVLLEAQARCGGR